VLYKTKTHFRLLATSLFTYYKFARNPVLVIYIKKKLKQHTRRKGPSQINESNLQLIVESFQEKITNGLDVSIVRLEKLKIQLPVCEAHSMQGGQLDTVWHFCFCKVT
jgi:hypothetical protein